MNVAGEKSLVIRAMNLVLDTDTSYQNKKDQNEICYYDIVK
jgi:hypothetical protein